jgi:hypothetical protein
MNEKRIPKIPSIEINENCQKGILRSRWKQKIMKDVTGQGRKCTWRK